MAKTKRKAPAEQGSDGDAHDAPISASDMVTGDSSPSDAPSSDEDFEPDNHDLDQEPGVFNRTIPFPLSHKRDINFYSAFGEEQSLLLLEVVKEILNVHESINSLILESEDEINDPFNPLAHTVQNAILSGLSSLRTTAYAIPEELSVALTVLGVADMMPNSSDSVMHSHFVRLHDAVEEFCTSAKIFVNIPYSND